MLAIAAVVASQRRRTRVPLSDAKRKLYKRLVEVALALFLAAIGLSPAPAIEGGPGAVDGLEDFLRAAKCEDWLVRAATWCKENGAETLDELLQCQPGTRAMFVEALKLPVVKREQLERQLAERLREQSSSADDHSMIPKSAAVNTPAAEAASTAIANKFLPDLPTFVFGDRSLYEDGILARVGNLSRSVQQEFEENERGIWLPELLYVTEQPAREAYPSTKGVAPSDALEPSYTRDLGRTGWTLSKFHEAQPTVPEPLSLAETAVLRTYTGPWFQAINFYLRYLPEVRCCDASPYYEHYNPGRCFLAKPGQMFHHMDFQRAELVANLRVLGKHHRGFSRP
jgi:hypothetical protein